MWSPTSSTWVVLSRMTVGWTQRSALGSARPRQHFSPCLTSCGISARSRPPPRYVFPSVIISTLLYGLESSVLLEPHICCLESFVIRCLRIILGISIRQKKHHNTICKMAKQQRISSILTQHHLHFLRHLSRMPDSCLSNQLLVSAPVGSKHSTGGQKHQ
jgi:hypothetical protein